MKVTLFDLVTGVSVTDTNGGHLFWWSMGNGSCDCNRAIAFGGFGCDVHSGLRKQYGEGRCFGSDRLIAVAAHGDLEGLDQSTVIAEINLNYPPLKVAAALVAYSEQLRKAGAA